MTSMIPTVSSPATKPIITIPPGSPSEISATSLRQYEGSTDRVNDYIGYTPPPGVTILTDREPVGALTPERFFAEYVRQRRPVAIAGHLIDPEWAGHRWTNEYLRQRAGRQTVLVERRPRAAAGKTECGDVGKTGCGNAGKIGCGDVTIESRNDTAAGSEGDKVDDRVKLGPGGNTGVDGTMGTKLATMDKWEATDASKAGANEALPGRDALVENEENDGSECPSKTEPAAGTAGNGSADAIANNSNAVNTSGDVALDAVPKPDSTACKPDTDAPRRAEISAKSEMPYARFLSAVERGDDSLYLTTQDLERDESDLDDYGMPQSIAGEPTRSLRTDYPARPRLLGNLVPYQLSIWQGAAPSGRSSGLHHDFHDNLYVLLRGRKRFRLFAPTEPTLRALPTAGGRPAKVHRNGLIVYEMKPGCRTVTTRADGTPLAFLARRKRDDAESELADAEDDLLCLGTDGGPAVEVETRRLRRVIADCEDLIDEAMAETIRYGDASDDEDEVISINDSSDDDDDDAREPAAKQPRLDGDAAANKQPSSSVGGGETKKSSEKADKKSKEDQADAPHLENNFSTVVLPESSDELELFIAKLSGTGSSAGSDHGVGSPPGGKNPDAGEGAAEAALMADGSREGGAGSGVGCLVVELRAGEMLYVPASWYHEVTSYNVDDAFGKATDSHATVGASGKNRNEIEQTESSNTEAVETGNGDERTTKDDKAEGLSEKSGLIEDVYSNVESTDSAAAPVTADVIEANKAAVKEVAGNGEAHVGKLSGVGDIELKDGTLNQAENSVRTDDASLSDNHNDDPAVSKTCVTVSNLAKKPPATTPNLMKQSLVTASNDRGHLAFNYWTYPPDGTTFTQPYVGDFWPHRWRELVALRCTMGRAARRDGCPPAATTGVRRAVGKPAVIESASSEVINLDSDDSDCVQMDDDDNDDDDDEEGDASFVEGGREERWSSPASHGLGMRGGRVAAGDRGVASGGVRGRGEAVTIDDTSSLCEIMDDDDDVLDDDDDSEGEEDTLWSTAGGRSAEVTGRSRGKRAQGVPAGSGHNCEGASGEGTVDDDGVSRDATGPSLDIADNGVNGSKDCDLVQDLEIEDLEKLEASEVDTESKSQAAHDKVCPCESDAQMENIFDDRSKGLLGVTEGVQGCDVTPQTVDQTLTSTPGVSTNGDVKNDKGKLSIDAESLSPPNGESVASKKTSDGVVVTGDELDAGDKMDLDGMLDGDDANDLDDVVDDAILDESFDVASKPQRSTAAAADNDKSAA